MRKTSIFLSILLASQLALSPIITSASVPIITDGNLENLLTPIGESPPPVQPTEENKVIDEEPELTLDVELDEDAPVISPEEMTNAELPALNRFMQPQLIVPLVATPEDQFTFVDNGDGTVTLTDYTGLDTDVVIPALLNGSIVVEVADGAFKGKQLTSITFEGDIRRVGREAFYGNSLSSVIFKGNVDLVEPKAFQENNVDMVWVVEGNLGILGDINITYDNNAGIGSDWNVDGRVFGKDDISPNTVDGDNYDRGSYVSISIQGSVNTLASGSLSLINLTSLSVNGNLNNMNERAISRSNVGNIYVQSDLGFVEKYSSYMANISNIEIIGGVNHFGDNAFAYATLERITVNGDIQNLGYQSFHYVNYFNPSKFLEVHFKGNVINVGDSVFYHGNISSLNIDGDIPFISKYMFNDLNFESKSAAALNFNGAVGYVEDYAFYYAGISSLYIVSGLTKLGEFSLNLININNNQFGDIVINGPIDTIGSWALYGAKIDNLTVNGSINTIKEYAAVDSKINKFNVKGDLGIVELKAFNIAKIGQLIVEGDFTTAGNSSFLESEIGSVLVEENIGTLEEDSFRESKIGPITVNGNVGTFGYSAMFKSEIGDITVLGDWDTIGNNSLSEATIGNITIKGNLNLVEEVSIRHSALKDFIVEGNLNTIETSGFLESRADNFEIYGNLNKANDCAFQGVKFKNIIIHGEVDYLGKYSFQQTEIDNIEFKGKVKIIDNYAFLQGKFKTIIFKDDVEEFTGFAFLTVTADKVEVHGKVSLLGTSTFQDAVIPIIHFYSNVDLIDTCAFLHTISDKVTFVGDVLETKNSTFLSADIGDVLFEGKILKIGESTFLSVNIRNSLVVMGDVGTIESQAFLTVDIPYTHFYGNIGEIGDLAFVNNRGKNGIGSNVVIVEGRVDKTGDSSFQHLRTDKFIVKKGIGVIGPRSFMVSDIKELEIFNNTTSLGKMAFFNAKLSKDPEVPNTVSDMEDAVFLLAEAPSYTVNSTHNQLGENFFREAKGLKTFNMMDTVNKVGNYAFQDTGIEKVKLSTNLESLGEESFLNHKLSCVTTNSKLTSIGKDSFKSTHVANEDFTIWGDKGSEAETYALANGHTFKENDVFSNNCDSFDWSIVVNYVDDTGAVLDTKTITKPNKGTYEEVAKSISGYTVIGNSKETVEVSSATPSHTIVFVYKKNKVTPTSPITKGTVTVVYSDGKGVILDSKVVKDLPLGFHTETAKVFSGYKLVSNNSYTIELTQANFTQTIVFNYDAVVVPPFSKGAVTVKYIDGMNNIADSKVVSNLPLGVHKEKALAIKGYELTSQEIQEVNITEALYNFTVTFTYSKSVEPTKPIEPTPLPPIVTPTVPDDKPGVTQEEEEVESDSGGEVGEVYEASKEKKRIIRDEGDGTFTTVPHYMQDSGKFKVTTKYDYGLKIVDRVELPFEDINGLFSSEELKDLYNYLIVNGTTPTTYSPRSNITRGQFSAMIARALELRPKTKKYTFKDVSWYKDEVQALYEAGVITGFTDGTFGENKTLTREQASAMIVRMLNYMDVDTIVSVQINLSDMSSISDYAKEPVKYLAYKHVLVSGDNVDFNPRDNLTRAQMAKVLMRSLRLSSWY